MKLKPNDDPRRRLHIHGLMRCQFTYMIETPSLVAQWDLILTALTEFDLKGLELGVGIYSLSISI